MSEATSYRFEAMGDNKSLKKALLRQTERIKYDEMMAERESIVKQVRKAALKQLIAQDNAVYEKELHAQGKTFYVQRT
ncbi:uncharacterized protein LOC144353388 [Saccoglossus kowalevskii]